MLKATDGTASERWHLSNKAWCCAKCNGLKGALHPFEWAWTLDETRQAAVLRRLREMDALTPGLLWNIRVSAATITRC